MLLNIFCGPSCQRALIEGLLLLCVAQNSGEGQDQQPARSTRNGEQSHWCGSLRVRSRGKMRNHLKLRPRLLADLFPGLKRQSGLPATKSEHCERFACPPRQPSQERPAEAAPTQVLYGNGPLKTVDVASLQHFLRSPHFPPHCFADATRICLNAGRPHGFGESNLGCTEVGSRGPRLLPCRHCAGSAGKVIRL